jgi:hypothetical protein
MQALELLNELWTDISIDFITRLLELEDSITRLKYDLILVVIDRFTKVIEVILF